MPSPASPLFCSWTPYCFIDQCLRSQLFVLRNFKLNPVIAQYSGEHEVSWWPSVRWMGINQSPLRQKTPGNPVGDSSAQACMRLMSDFGLQIRWESVLLFLWCGDCTQTGLCISLPNDVIDLYTLSLFQKRLGRTGRARKSEFSYGLDQQQLVSLINC